MPFEFVLIIKGFALSSWFSALPTFCLSSISFLLICDHFLCPPLWSLPICHYSSLATLCKIYLASCFPIGQQVSATVYLQWSVCFSANSIKQSPLSCISPIPNALMLLKFSFVLVSIFVPWNFLQYDYLDSLSATALSVSSNCSTFSPSAADVGA